MEFANFLKKRRKEKNKIGDYLGDPSVAPKMSIIIEILNRTKVTGKFVACFKMILKINAMFLCTLFVNKNNPGTLFIHEIETSLWDEQNLTNKKKEKTT